MNEMDLLTKIEGLEKAIKEHQDFVNTYSSALTTIDDALYELLDDTDGNEEEFYMDYKEAFGHVVEQLKRFHNVED